MRYSSMVVPRVLVYGTLIVLAVLVLLDTNVGSSISVSENAALKSAARYLDLHGFHDEARAVSQMIDHSSFRTSRFFSNLGQIAAARGAGFAYYAYTPLFSRSRVFLGDSFWEVGDTGRSSIIVHELAHIEHHKRSPLGGLPRRRDEEQAYERQYLTHRALRLSQYGEDGTVYSDMMLGVKKYVVPVHPEYARRADIAPAMRLMAQEEGTCSMTDLAVIAAYFLVALLLLAVGDRLGSRVACRVFDRCEGAPLLHLGPWVLPLALLTPGLIMLGFFAMCMRVHSRSAIEVLADNLEWLILATFFLTGLTGGFFTHTGHGDT